MFGWEMLTSSESSSYACNRDQNEFCPQKNILCSTLWSVFLYGCCYLRSNTQNAAQFEQHCAYLNNISRIWETFCIEEDNLQKGNAFWGEENYISVRGRNIVGNIASETTFDHWKVVFLMSKSEKKWEKGAWSKETPPTPFSRSTRSQNSCQIQFSSRNGREISDSVFWND